MTGLDLIDQLHAVKRVVDDAGGQAAFARKIGVSRQFINSVMSAKAEPTDAILRAAGLRRVVLRANA